MAKSPFSQIVDREIPASIVYEDDDFIAFHDIHPKAPVHVLIVTKKPYKTLEEVPLSDKNFHGNLLLTARKVAKQLNIADDYKLQMKDRKSVV